MGDYLLPSCNPLFLSWSPPTSPAPTPPSPPPPASLSLLTNSGLCTADDCGFRRNLCWPDLLVSSANSAPSLQGPLFKSGDASDLTYTSFAAAGSSAAGRLTDFDSERLTDSFVDLSLGELASRTNDSLRPSFDEDVFLALSNSFSDFSVCSSDISGELHRLATLTVDQSDAVDSEAASEHEPCAGFLQRETFSTEIIEHISPEVLQPNVKICIEGLQSPSLAVKIQASSPPPALDNKSTLPPVCSRPTTAHQFADIFTKGLQSYLHRLSYQSMPASTSG